MAKTLILTMAFGTARNMDICRTNQKLAEETLKEMNKFRTVAFVEKDVADEMKDTRSFLMKVGGKIHVYDGNGQKYLPSLKVIKAFKVWQKSKHADMEEILLIAAPPHQTRCKRDLGIVFSGVPVLVPTFLGVEEDFWFNKGSIQWWTRSEKAWEFKERLIFKLPWRVYEWLSMR